MRLDSGHLPQGEQSAAFGQQNLIGGEKEQTQWVAEYAVDEVTGDHVEFEQVPQTQKVIFCVASQSQ
ncbi:MAG TPA: hypothetical protein VF671_20680 [Pseudomonas sp.]|uniref:hypothetical protein n=1 Tax=Pseudomonas sp. TaxID=306 RepID=UPI002EDA99B4